MANNAELVAQCEARAKEWLSPSFDEATRKEVQAMLDDEDKSNLIDAFYRDLEFGTHGCRNQSHEHLYCRYGNTGFCQLYQ